MNVIIDGVEYAPRHTADKGGRVKSLAQLFKEGRAHKHLTMEQAAKLSGCSMNQVNRAESGGMAIDVAFKLAQLYGIPTDQLSRAVLRK